jgi:L-ascorbate metabolism protein UlaG (beta-lactamase superfamily)
MGETQFVYQYEELSPSIRVTVHKDADLDEMVEAFRMFLAACGYPIENYSLELVPNKKD